MVIVATGVSSLMNSVMGMGEEGAETMQATDSQAIDTATATDDFFPSTEVGAPLKSSLSSEGEGIRTLSLRCSNLPKASKQFAELGETVRHAAKSLMSGGDTTSAFECQKQVLHLLDSGERRQFELVMTVVKGGHSCKDLIQAVMDTHERIDKMCDLTGRGAGSNVKFDSKYIQSEMQRITDIVKDFGDMESRLKKFCDTAHREAALKVIQEARNQLVNSDLLREIQEVWKGLQQYEQELHNVLAKRGEKEAQALVQKTEKEFLETKLDQLKEHVDALKSMLDSKKVELQTLKRTARRSKDDLLASCQARANDLERRQNELSKKQEEEEKRIRAPLDACEAQLEVYRQELLDLDSFNIKEIILAVDNSGSMGARTSGWGSPTRWQHAVKAVEAFQKALLSRGSQDKVSVLCFNSRAKCLVQSAAVESDIVESLKKEGCTGGTCFASAWDKIQECVEADPKFARIFIVFLTDGLSGSWDISRASKKAEAIHGSCSEQKRSMCSYFVHILESGSGVESVQESLQPLVKAANGGRTLVEYPGDKIALLQLAKVEDLTTVFEKLTSLVNLEKCMLEARISMLRVQASQYKEKSAQDGRELQKRYKEKSKELKQTARALEKSKSGKQQQQLEKMYVQFEKELEDEVQNLEQEHKDAQEEMRSLKQEVAECDRKFRELEEGMKSTQSSHDEMVENLQKASQTHLTQLGHIGKKQQKLLDTFGTTSSTLLVQQLDSLDKMRKQFGQNCLIEEDLHALASRIVRWTAQLKDQIEKPLPGGTDKISNAKVVLKSLLQQRGLPYKGVQHEDMQELLKYESKFQKSDPDQVCDFIREAGIKAEDLCKLVGETKASKVDEFKEDLIEEFTNKILALRECSVGDVENQLQTKKEDLKAKKEEIRELQQKLKDSKKKSRACRSNVSTASEEEQEWEVVGDLEAKVTLAQAEKSRMDDEVKALNSKKAEVKKSEQEIVKEIKPCCRLLELMVDLCQEAFQEHIAEEEKAALKSIFDTFTTTVREPIAAFLTMSQQARQVFNQASFEAPMWLESREAGQGLAIQDIQYVE